MEAMLASSWRWPAAGVRLLRRSSWPAASSMRSAAVFSSTRATRRVPGIGAMSSPWASSQASAICAGTGLGQADVKHLALGDQLGQRADGLLDGRVRVDPVLVVQVDVVRTEPLEGSL
jgi:hypothetical protein